VPARKLTNPGGFSDDETPTAPGEVVKLLEGFVACTLDRRVLLRALAGELAKIHAAEV
jgi:hypothetical protein